MANVHNIRIRGRLPYNIVEKGSERVVRWFARMSSPSWGLHVEYGKETYKNATETEIYSLCGGLIFLRWVIVWCPSLPNPAIRQIFLQSSPVKLILTAGMRMARRSKKLGEIKERHLGSAEMGGQSSCATGNG